VEDDEEKSVVLLMLNASPEHFVRGTVDLVLSHEIQRQRSTLLLHSNDRQRSQPGCNP
jgi:hypothetical protein